MASGTRVPSMEHKTINTGSGEVHYWVHKKENQAAQCLLFTHGLTADHRMFEKQTAYFCAEYSVLTWDVPLHGLSRPYRDFSYEKTATEMKKMLDEEGINSVVLVGMSMGGYPSQMFAGLFPERVAGFVALDTTPFGLAYYSETDLWWLRKVAPIARCCPGGLLKKSMAKSVSKTRYSYEKMMDMLAPLNKAEIAEQMDVAYGKFAMENKDIDLACPVLLLLGDSDKTGKVKQYNGAWAAKTGYPLHIIQRAAHFSNGDNPTQVNAEIEAFLRGL